MTAAAGAAAPAPAAWRGFDGGFGFAFAGAAAPPGGRGSGSAIARKTCDSRRVGCIATRFGACAREMEGTRGTRKKGQQFVVRLLVLSGDDSKRGV